MLKGMASGHPSHSNSFTRGLVAFFECPEHKSQLVQKKCFWLLVLLGVPVWFFGCVVTKCVWPCTSAVLVKCCCPHHPFHHPHVFMSAAFWLKLWVTSQPFNKGFAHKVTFAKGAKQPLQEGDARCKEAEGSGD